VDLTPSFDAFARAYEAGQNQVVHTRLAADLDTPVSLMLKLTGAARDAFMLCLLYTSSEPTRLL
jgi:anthranilate synthase component 1